VNVFVETNFLVELALEQAGSAACERLLSLAEADSIGLFLPAYCFVEPHEMLRRRHRERTLLQERVSSELTQLGRSAPLAERAAASAEIVKLLADSIEYETRRIEDVKRRVTGIAEVLPLDSHVVEHASVWQNVFDLSPQDAIVYASIRARLERDGDAQLTSCFVSRNPKDFGERDIKEDMERFNCKYFPLFETALEYIEHTLRQAGA